MCVWCVSVFVVGVTYELSEYGEIVVELDDVEYFFAFSLFVSDIIIYFFVHCLYTVDNILCEESLSEIFLCADFVSHVSFESRA